MLTILLKNSGESYRFINLLSKRVSIPKNEVISHFLLDVFAMIKKSSRFSFLNKECFMGFAHRGFSHTVQENTLEAFAIAHDLGFKNFELDVRQSADSNVYVCHDDNLERLLGEPLLLSRLSSNEIKNLEFSHRCKIPLLTSVLEEFPDAKLINVTLKKKED